MLQWNHRLRGVLVSEIGLDFFTTHICVEHGPGRDTDFVLI